MSLASHLRHRCTIQRAATTQDEYGTDVPDWATHLIDVRCRLVISEQRVPFSELAERPIVTTYTLMVAPRTDVREGDQVTYLTFEDGSADAGPYRIESVLPRRSHRKHHITLKLEKVV